MDANASHFPVRGVFVSFDNDKRRVAARPKTKESMRYVLKQKLFCWGDDFKIKNEAGEDVFFVDGKAFTIREKLSFQDKD